MRLIFRNAKVVDNRATGRQVRKFRERSGASLRLVARTMDISPPYLSDLELGKKNWTQVLLDGVESAIQYLAS